jgi:Heterokaryon incompatibility protein (HET)
MGQIYERADSVIVWLGPASEDSSRAINFVKEMASYQSMNLDMALQREYFLDLHQEDWGCLINLFQPQYWTRTWIIQEFLLARDIEVVCGAERLQWSLFEGLVTVSHQLFNGRQKLRPGTLSSIVMKSIPFRLTTKRLRRDRTSDLESLMTDFYDSQCSKARDKVYGMLGIADDFKEDQIPERTPRFKPDYSKDIAEVYFDVLHYFNSSSPTGRVSTTTAVLLQKVLNISSDKIAEYAATLATQPLSLAQIRSPAWQIRPDYVGRVQEVLQVWSNPQELKAKLLDWRWRSYVGATTTRFRKPKSPFIHEIRTTRPLPADLIGNAVDAAHHAAELESLYNYPGADEFCVPFTTFSMSHEAKRRVNNPPSQLSLLPSVIFEYSGGHASSLRIGFACTDVRQNDRICQFAGLDTTLIVRQVEGGWKLVGKALMMTHCQLHQRLPMHPVCKATPWFSHCIDKRNPDMLSFKVDAVSFAELMS